VCFNSSIFDPKQFHKDTMEELDDEDDDDAPRPRINKVVVNLLPVC